MKKILVFAISAAVVAGTVAGFGIAGTDTLGLLTNGNLRILEIEKEQAETMAASQLIFEADFNDQSVTAKVGAATESAAKGTYVKSYDGTMAYQFNNSYFMPTTEDGGSLLAGLDEFTVAYWGEMSGNSNGKVGWTLYAAPDTTVQTLRNETYIGIFDNGTTLTSERYKNTGSRPKRIDAADLPTGWKHIALVQKADKAELYINGVLKTSVSSSITVPSILGDTPLIQVGMANWGSKGEYAAGIIDNYQIYNYALSATEILDIYNDEYVAPPTPVPEVEWETAVDSIKTGEGDEATGTLRFLASVSDDNGYDISKGEYGFVFVNFDPDTVTKDYMGETEIPEFTGETDSNTKSTTESVAQNGLQKNKAYFVDIEDIPLSVSKIGVYAVPYITLEDGYVIYGPPFTAKKFNWAAE